jgi:uncharacterized delta-60 repeat protein
MVLALSPASAFAAGALDPTFHEHRDDPGGAIAGAGPGGTAIVQDEVGVFRLRRDDRIDRTFGGGDGYVPAGVPSNDVALTEFNQVAVTAAGDVFMATSWFRYVPLRWETSVLRLRPDGRVETAFGDNGRHVHVGGYAVGIAAAPDGGVLLSLQVGGFYDTPHAGLLKLDAEGRPDASFGVDGLVEPSAGLHARFPEVGYSGPDPVVGGATDDQAIFGRFTPTGRPAPGFGPTGVRGLGQGAVTALLPRPGGKVLVAGHIVGWPFALWRLLADGRPDPSFGGGLRVSASLVRPTALVAQRDGRIVVAVSAAGKSDVPTLVRFRPDGRRDPLFRGAPVDRAPAQGEFPNPVLTGLVQRPDGRVTASGRADIESRYDYGYVDFLARWTAGDAAVAVRSERVRAGRRAVRLRVRCRAPRGTRCRGVLRLTALDGGRRVGVGGRRLSLAPGPATSRSVALTARARDTLRTNRALTVLAETTIRDRVGYVDVRRAVLRLRAA